MVPKPTQVIEYPVRLPAVPEDHPLEFQVEHREAPEERQPEEWARTVSEPCSEPRVPSTPRVLTPSSSSSQLLPGPGPQGPNPGMSIEHERAQASKRSIEMNERLDLGDLSSRVLKKVRSDPELNHPPGLDSLTPVERLPSDLVGRVRRQVEECQRSSSSEEPGPSSSEDTFLEAACLETCADWWQEEGWSETFWNYENGNTEMLCVPEEAQCSWVAMKTNSNQSGRGDEVSLKNLTKEERVRCSTSPTRKSGEPL